MAGLGPLKGAVMGSDGVQRSGVLLMRQLLVLHDASLKMKGFERKKDHLRG